MGHDPAQLCAAVVQTSADLDQFGIAGPQAAAVAIAVDLDQCRDRLARGLRRFGNRLHLRKAVDQDDKVAAVGAQFQHAGQLLRRDAHRIEDILHPGCGKDLGLGQGGDRRRARPARQHAARHVDGFRGLEMGAQRDAERLRLCRQPPDVARHARFVQHQAGRGQPVQARVRIVHASVLCCLDRRRRPPKVVERVGRLRAPPGAYSTVTKIFLQGSIVRH